VAFLSANASSGNTSYDGAFNSVYWDVGTLAINQTESLNITVAVGPTLPPDWGGFTTPYLFNTASVGADQADSETNNNQVTVNTTVIQPMVDLAIAKSDDPDPVMPGANLTYSINVTNNEVPFGLWPGTDVIVGPTAATGVITTDQLPQEVAFLSANASSGNTSYDGAFHTVYWDVGTLAINQTESLNITVAVGPNQPPDWGGFTTPNIFNQASVGTSNELETEFNNNQTTVNTTVIQPMIDLAIAKSDDPDPVMPGANLTYSINVTNNEVPFGLWPGTDVIVGPTAATGVITTDQLPQEVAFLSANASSGNTSYDGAFHTVYWDVGTLAINQTESLNITVAVGPQAANLTIFNQASVGTSNELETEFNNNQTTVNTTVIAPPGADLEITKSDSPESIIAGGNLTYTVTVTNYGPQDATGVNVTDNLFPFVSVNSTSASKGSISVSRQNISGFPLDTVNWYVGDLAANASASLTIVTTTNKTMMLYLTMLNFMSANITADSITNVANVTAGVYDPDLSNNTVTENTTLASTDLAIAKTDSADPVFLTDNFTYTVTVSNNGTENATGVQVYDLYPDFLVFHSVTPSTGTVNQTTASIDQLISLYSAFTAFQQTSGAGLSELMNQLGFLTSSGNFSGLSWDIGDLPAGASANLTILASANTTFLEQMLGGYSIDLLMLLASIMGGGQMPFDLAYPVFDMALVTSDLGDPDFGNNLAVETTNLTLDLPVADLEVTKTDDPDPVTLGENLTYTVNVTNHGPEDATGVFVLDIFLLQTPTIQSLTPSTGSANLSLPQWLTNAATSAGGSASLPWSPVIWWDIGDLAVGASANLTILTTVNATMQPPLYNLAMVLGRVNDPQSGFSFDFTNPDSFNITNNMDLELTSITGVDLAISKSGGPDPVPIGGNLTYSVNVTNHGPLDATGVNVTDVLPPGVTFQSATPSVGSASHSAGNVTWNVDSLAVNQTASLSILATAPPTTGVITNRAIVSNQYDYNQANNTANLSITVTNATDADLSISKYDAPDPVYTGENLTYTLIVKNWGLAAATGVTVTDTLPSGVAFVSANESQGNASHSAGTVTWNVGSLAKDASANLTILVTAPATSGNITNEASVSANETDPNGNNNLVNIDTEVIPFEADLSVAKSASPDPVLTSGNLTYSINVTNFGPDGATGVTVLDDLPGGVTYQSYNASQGTASHSTGTVTWNVGSLANGASANMTILVTAPSFTGDIINDVSVSGNGHDPNGLNNTDFSTTQVTDVDLYLGKDDSSDPVTAGDNLTYTLYLSNDGNGTATGVTVTDTLPPEVTYLTYNTLTGSANHSAGTITWNVGNLTAHAHATLDIKVNVKPDTTGTITNNAVAASDQSDAWPSDNDAREDTEVFPPDVDLYLNKSDSSDPAIAGDNLTYTLYLSNDGNDTATGVTIIDNLPPQVTYLTANGTAGSANHSAGTVTWNVGNLAAHAHATLDIKVNVKPGTSGTITNTANASSDQSDTWPFDNDDTEQTTVFTTELDYIIVSPDAANITAGDNQTYTAEAFASDNSSLGDVTTSTTFTIDPGAFGSWTDNVYTSEKAGNWTVTGTYSGKSDTANLTVTPGPLDYFAIAPQVAGVLTGDNVTYISGTLDRFDNLIALVTANTTFSIDAGAGGSWAANVILLK
jgi:uncharacterized repeat protein (TIGR01451 family)